MDIFCAAIVFNWWREDKVKVETETEVEVADAFQKKAAHLRCAAE